jgi:hypothetical protein
MNFHFQVCLQSDKNNWHFVWGLTQIYIKLDSPLLQKFQIRVTEKIKTHIAFQIYLFQQTCCLHCNWIKYCTARRAKEMIIRSKISSIQHLIIRHLKVVPWPEVSPSVSNSVTLPWVTRNLTEPTELLYDFKHPQISKQSTGGKRISIQSTASNRNMQH